MDSMKGFKERKNKVNADLPKMGEEIVRVCEERK